MRTGDAAAVAVETTGAAVGATPPAAAAGVGAAMGMAYLIFPALPDAEAAEAEEVEGTPTKFWIFPSGVERLNDGRMN